MIKKILSIALMFSGIVANAQAFTATYSFAATTTVSGTTDPSAPPSVTGITFGSFTAVGTPSSNPNAAGRFSFVGWPVGSTNGNDTYSTYTGAINTNEYYEVIITPQPGYTVGINTIAFTVQRSGTGIRNYSVRTSVNNFATNLPASVSSTSLSVVGTDEFFWNYDANSSATNGSLINLFGATVTSSVSLRFYGWNSEGSGGTFSIDNVSFDGTVTGSVTACNSPTINTISSNSPICSNKNLLLSSSASGDMPLTYSWTGTGSFNSNSVSSPTVTGAASGNYVLTVTNSCGTATAAVTATVNPAPSVTVNSANICSGGNAVLTANGAATYSWSPSATLSASTGSVVTANPTSTTIYTIVGTTGSCSVAATSTVTIISTPTLAVTSATVCNGTFATLTASGVSTYTWVTPAVNTPTISVNPTATTIYTVSGNASGCAGTFTSTGTVTVNQLPTVTSTSATICSGKTATLTASGAATYVWSPGGSTGATFTVAPVSAFNTYTVVGTSSVSCSKSATVNVFVVPTPTLNVTSTASVICKGQPVTLTASGAATYSWTSGVTNGTAFTPTNTATYTVTGTSFVGSCTNTAVASVTVNLCTGIKENNESFTLAVYPNPNNGNFIVTSSVYPAEISMYDVTGKLIMKKGITEIDTTVNVSQLNSGVYYLIVSTETNSVSRKLVITK